MSTEPSELTGTFITIEGGEGSGKSTLTKLLQNLLNKSGHWRTIHVIDVRLVSFITRQDSKSAFLELSLIHI